MKMEVLELKLEWYLNDIYAKYGNLYYKDEEVDFEKYEIKKKINI